MAVKDNPIRLIKVAKEFNVGTSTIVDFLMKKGFEINSSPNTKLTQDEYALVGQEFQSQKSVKEEAKKIGLDYSDHKTISLDEKSIGSSQDDQDEKFDEIFIKDQTFSADPFKPKKAEVPPPKVDKIIPEPKPSIPETPKKEEAKPEPKPKLVSEPKSESPIEKEKEEEPVIEEKTISKPETIKAKESEEKPEVKIEKPVEVIEPVETKQGTPEKVSEKKTEEVAEPIEVNKKGQPVVLGQIDLDSMNMKTKPRRKTSAEKKKEREKQKEDSFPIKKKAEKPVVKEEKPEVIETKASEVTVEAEKKEEVKGDNIYKTQFKKLVGPKILDKIELPVEKKKSEKKPVASSRDNSPSARKKRKRKRLPQNEQKAPQTQQPKADDKQQTRKPPVSRSKRGKKDHVRPEISEVDIQQQIKETLAKLTGGGKSKAVKHRKDKRESFSQQRQKDIDKLEDEKNIIKVTEFVTANELATMMNVQVNQVISTCMSLGLFVSINQRLDAETLSLVAEEFSFKVEFVSVDVAEAILEGSTEEEDESQLEPRAPIVTVMGHVDHGKTKLLDYIRKANVVAGEAGGITQHIGAYEVILEDGRKITFLDTPGHEAFTAMRARGAQVTDVAIIVIAAEDNVMPQTKEAINHAQAAGVPIVFAINKIDKPQANPEKIKEELAAMNILVEDWGGKFQSQEISAKEGLYVSELLEKVLLEAEMLDLKANPNKPAFGTVIESSLDKGRGYVAKVLVQEGTMKTGDVVIAGSTIGRVKAMYNERNIRVESAGPSTPVLLLGLNGAPQAGDGFNILTDEKEAKAIANKRMQLQREQGIRTQKHVTLDEIGRRIAIGDFKELNVIVKGDVDGSVEALSDSLLKLSNEQIQVNIILKAVGAVTETDVMLASASDAIIVAFQVRPTMNARKLAEQEQIDLRLYSIIYQAIDEIKSAMEGMLSPDIEEKIICNVAVREVYNITKVGTVAGCLVLDGIITRKTHIRVIRDGIVIHTGFLGSLKRFKDDVKEVKSGYECGLNIDKYNDIKVGDIIEGYEEVEVKRTL